MSEKILMTALSPTMEKGTVSSWLKNEGDEVKPGDVICEVETDKAVMDYEADFEGYILKIVLEEGGSAAVGETIAYYGEQGEEPVIEEKAAQEPVKPTVPSDSESIESDSAPSSEGRFEEKPSGKPFSADTGDHRIKASPLARRMADDMNIELSSVKGSGPGGRIVKRDIQDRKPTANLGSEKINLGGMRGVIAQRLSESKFSAPHYYLTVTADAQAILDSRKKKSKDGGAVSFNSYLIKLAAMNLMKHRIINSSWNNGDPLSFSSADIGFAVAVENGLIAPVIRSCETKGIRDIDKEFRDLAERAKTGSVKPEEYSNAGFTISNLGSFGIEEFTAIINPPGSAILAVGAIIKTPVVRTDPDTGEDSLEIRPVFKMTLSADHRLIDGAVGAAFLADLKRSIEDPIEALM